MKIPMDKVVYVITYEGDNTFLQTQAFSDIDKAIEFKRELDAYGFKSNIHFSIVDKYFDKELMKKLQKKGNK